MTDVNIFEVVQPQSGEFFKFKNIGDGIQGTYVSRREGIDSYENEQIIYVLLDKDGKIWNIGFRKVQIIIHETMNLVRFGQIVGFRYDEDRDSKRNPGTKAHIIRIYADPKLVDNEWIEAQKGLGNDITAPPAAIEASTSQPTQGEIDPVSIFPDTNISGDVTVPEQNLPNDETIQVQAAATSDEPLEAIRNLAKGKGLITDAMSVEEGDKAIEEQTGMALEEANFTKTIIALVGYTG